MQGYDFRASYHWGWDKDVAGMLGILPNFPAQEQYAVFTKVKAVIVRNSEGATLGATLYPWWNRTLRSLDKWLRLAFEYHENEWQVQRFDTWNCVWNRIMPVMDLSPYGLEKAMALLREGDMQRFARPQDYLAFKREQAAVVRKNNEHRSREKLGAVIDDHFSERGAAEFLQIEKAIVDGEKMICHGSDERFMERASEFTRRAEAQGEQLDNAAAAMTPGFHPKLQKAVRKHRPVFGHD